MRHYVEGLQRRVLLAAVTGTVFRDTNYDNVHQSNETVYTYGTAFVDLDGNGRLTAGEPSAAVDTAGNFSIDYDVPADGYYPVSVVGNITQLRYLGPDDTLAKPVYLTRAGGGNAGDMSVALASFVNAGLFGDENNNGTYEINAGDTLAQDARLYVDRNNNGRLDAGEQSSTPEVLDSSQYNAAVVWFKPGTVTIRADFPSYYRPSFSNDNGAITRTFASGSYIEWTYFGAYAVTAVTGRAYTDANRDGVLGADETTFQSRLIYADENNNGRLDAGEPQTTSTYNGNYVLPVPAGTHTIRQVMSDFPAVPNTQSFTVTASGAGRFAAGDFASPPSGVRVVGSVFLDANGNGVQDPGETAPPVGVTKLTVYSDPVNVNRYPTGYYDPSVRVNADGTYVIDLPYYGSERLRLDGISQFGGLYQTTGNVNTGLVFEAQRGVTYAAPAFGIQPRSAVSGHIYRDYNANGQYERVGDDYGSGDLVYADLNDNARFDAGEPSATTGTYVGGLFKMLLTPGTYTLRQQLPAGYVQTGPAANAGIVITVPDDGSDVTAGDFFRYTPNHSNAVLTGSVFNDANGNGVQDAGESTDFPLGAPGVYLDLNNDGVRDISEPSNVVNPNGVYTLFVQYDFRQDWNGTVRFYSQNTNWLRQTTPAVNTRQSDYGQLTTLPTAGLMPTQTFALGFTPFNDVNGNGRLNTGENYLNGRTIYADLNGSGALDAGEPSAVSSNYGYGVLYLPLGTYTVRQVSPAGFVETGRFTTSKTPGITFVEDGRVRVIDDTQNGTFYFGSRPAWLTASADATYRFDGTMLSVTAGTVTLTADAGQYVPKMVLVASGTARVEATTGLHLYRLTLGDSATFALAAGGNKLLRVGLVNIAAAAKLDLNDNALIVDYAGASPQAAVSGYLRTGRNGGAWDGVGLASSAATASGNTAALGLMEAAAYRAIYGADATFAGEAVAGSAVLVKYTAAGDANFNGTTNFSDFLRLQGHFLSAGTFGDGDFNYDGVVNFSDFLILQGNFLVGVTATPGLTVRQTPTTPMPAMMLGTGAVSGYAFNDHNRNGRYDRGDGVGRGVRVFIDTDNDGVLDDTEPSVLADANGRFAFNGLAAGRYVVRAVPAKGTRATPPAATLVLKAGGTFKNVVVGMN